ncbi:N-terminal C2 in EEIG1 and EHBP1 proteins-domain-containing protein [Zalerion maritima]|uniref:N-terminal C2 in EEIG1 and EHBP1 proteins-domain-containing protein n=1 Tax=Zalerion maritima TaxID=339359 RepID=A0AAD5RRC2_9PEZI|nr:N-terminal C2 in EEIG1 and EHBP1 proteins-domain-containing protein [Zalerion maritima]
MLGFIPVVNKGRKPKFELHLKVSTGLPYSVIYDLNNVPLVTGTSLIKWYLPHSIHGEHRGRTAKCPISNHRVDYSYSKLVVLRIGIDKTNNLQECPIEFEVTQEFGMANGGGGGGRDEKITLGFIRLNLSEYVEESEVVARDSLSLDLAQYSSPGARGSISYMAGTRRRSSTVHRHHYHRHDRKKSAATARSTDGISPTRRASNEDGDSKRVAGAEDKVQDGIVRRYLMQESKVNSTLKIGILMVQIDGDKGFVAPPLKTAPVFGGIAGLMGADPVEGTEEVGPTALPTLSKPRDASEQQDMYRRALAASWCCQPGELPAHECIEDIFAGGNGWRPDKRKGGRRSKQGGNVDETVDDTPDEGGGLWGGNGWRGSGVGGRQSSGHEWEDSMAGGLEGGSTLKASDIARIKHLRALSGTSDRSNATVIGPSRHTLVSSNSDPFLSSLRRREHSGDSSRRRGGLRSEETLTPANVVAAAARDNESNKKVPVPVGNRSRSESIASLATTLGSDGRQRYDGYRKQREVDEFEVREDLVAWSLPGSGEIST